MFSKRKSSADHGPGLEEVVLRPRSVHRPPSPRRSSFHGSERQLSCEDQQQFSKERKPKYPTAPITHHRSASSRERPVTPTKNRNIPQPTYQKTFIAMLKGKDSRVKRRSQEFVECPSPLAQPMLHPRPTSTSLKHPCLPPKPTFYQPMHSNLSMGAQQLVHAGLNHHYEQLYHVEPIPPMKRETTRLYFGAQLPPVKHHHKKKEGQVNRSESLKEKQPRRKRTRENRKHSDPNIPTSKSGDVDADSSLIPDNSGSSSNSSLSPSLESPSHSLEHVSREGPVPAPALENDSDIECEADLPNWQKLVPSDEVKKLKPKQRKRQDTINELFHTERTHVRVLKVLKHLFQVPMSDAGLLSRQQLDLLFPNLDEMLDIHITFNQAMKKRRLEEPIVSRVGDVLINMFDGEQGDHFQQQAAEFVRSQFLALENLKQQQKRDQRLANFLQEQENNLVCRRLQLKDMLPAGFQRLSKYPLLIESLLGYTDSTAHPEEYEQLSRALERSKEILAYVNTAVQEAENSQRLHELQRKLDQSSLAKNKHGQVEELKGNLDLTKHKMIYEGTLTWRVAKGQKNIDLLVLLLDDFIVLLQKADDKYILKNHSIIKSAVKDENKLTHSPIIKYGPSMLFRAVATGKHWGSPEQCVIR
ncbi:Rho guanine nucleotide exchange factor 12 [Chionoecetes opilio]|uniref:Rho guanine nucleotide exchange factor 12 n=1 Tax=Chionoecetes opilio TaxID=41210 RepID=A0A8J5CQU3_CHIOP|nr:Rho guanine nucleotide exchange factor 12 [Chionoecetes opilio]